MGHPRTLESAWTAIGVIVGVGGAYLGAGYAFAGESVTRADGWRVLTRFMPGGLHCHGAITFALSVWLLVELGQPYTVWTRRCLRAIRTYYLIVAACWFGSWAHYGVTWGAPALWCVFAALTVWMTWYAPAVTRTGRRA